MSRASLLVVWLLVGVFATACSSGGKHLAKRQTLTYQYTAFNQLDPQRVSDGAPIAGQNLLEGMVTPDAAGTGVLPATADTWTVSPDGTVYTFHIRSGAKWSNGTHVSVKALDHSRLRITLETANTNFLEGMAYTSMVPLPKKTLEQFPYSWQT